MYDPEPRFLGTLTLLTGGRPVVISRAGRPVERTLPQAEGMAPATRNRWIPQYDVRVMPV